jgi:hypothetical protein
MTDERPWRVENLTFEPRGSGLEATLFNGHEIARQNGKYKIRQYREYRGEYTANEPKWDYYDLDEKGANAVLATLWVSK